MGGHLAEHRGERAGDALRRVVDRLARSNAFKEYARVYGGPAIHRGVLLHPGPRVEPGDAHRSVVLGIERTGRPMNLENDMAVVSEEVGGGELQFESVRVPVRDEVVVEAIAPVFRDFTAAGPDGADG